MESSAALRPRSGSDPDQLHRRIRHRELLRVGVDGDELDSMEVGVDHALQGVETAAADSDDADRGEVGRGFATRTQSLRQGGHLGSVGGIGHGAQPRLLAGLVLRTIGHVRHRGRVGRRRRIGLCGHGLGLRLGPALGRRLGQRLGHRSLGDGRRRRRCSSRSSGGRALGGRLGHVLLRSLRLPEEIGQRAFAHACSTFAHA